MKQKLVYKAVIKPNRTRKIPSCLPSLKYLLIVRDFYLHENHFLLFLAFSRRFRPPYWIPRWNGLGLGQ